MPARARRRARRYAGAVTADPPEDDRDPLFPPHQAYPPEPDGVDEASEESFPASDPPSSWSHED
jgi:hypothetical protein